jgi:hypothetical protein
MVRNLTAVPIEGIAPSQVVVVTRSGERRGLLRDALTGSGPDAG